MSVPLPRGPTEQSLSSQSDLPSLSPRPLGTFGDAWRHFCCHSWVWVWGACYGPSTKNHQYKISVVLRLRKPSLKPTQGLESDSKMDLRVSRSPGILSVLVLSCLSPEAPTKCGRYLEQD